MSKLFDLESFKRGEFAVNCRTEQDAKSFMNYLCNNNIKWCTGKDANKFNFNWEHYKSNTSYSFIKDGLTYCGIDYDLSGGVFCDCTPVYPYQYFTFPEPEPTRPDMKLIAQAFGVELGERFNLIDMSGNKISNCPYKVTDCGLTDCNNNKKKMYDSIIIGLYQIEKIP